MPEIPSSVPVLDDVEIPASELSFLTSPSSGPGGQRANKVETRVTLTFDVSASSSLDDEQKERIRKALETRITKAGLLRVTAQRERSQAANKALVVARFADLLRNALEEEAERKPTKVPKRSRRKRLREKRRRSEIKRLRKPPKIEE